REKAILENPQIFQNCKLKNIFSADYAQSNAERIQNRAAPGRGRAQKMLPLAGEQIRYTTPRCAEKKGVQSQFSFLP
uniref:hypothetical protein n=1 Tax=Faecalibacterium prausnitzii TaxID=853 RepID=UPI004028B19E